MAPSILGYFRAKMQNLKKSTGCIAKTILPEDLDTIRGFSFNIEHNIMIFGEDSQQFSS